MGRDYQLISADSHVLEPPHIWTTYMPKKFHDKLIGELDVRRNFGVNILGIRRRIPHKKDNGEIEYEEQINNVPAADDFILPDDVLYLVGTEEDLKKLQ